MARRPPAPRPPGTTADPVPRGRAAPFSLNPTFTRDNAILRASGHGADACDDGPCARAFDAALPVPGQSAASCQTGEGTLDDPLAGQHLQARRRVGASQDPARPLAHRHERAALRPRMAPVGEGETPNATRPSERGDRRSHGHDLRIGTGTTGTASRSCPSAAWTTMPNSRPMVSTTAWRLRPSIFLPFGGSCSGFRSCPPRHGMRTARCLSQIVLPTGQQPASPARTMAQIGQHES